MLAAFQFLTPLLNMAAQVKIQQLPEPELVPSLPRAADLVAVILLHTTVALEVRVAAHLVQQLTARLVELGLLDRRDRDTTAEITTHPVAQNVQQAAAAARQLLAELHRAPMINQEQVELVVHCPSLGQALCMAAVAVAAAKV